MFGARLPQFTRGPFKGQYGAAPQDDPLCYGLERTPYYPHYQDNVYLSKYHITTSFLPQKTCVHPKYLSNTYGEPNEDQPHSNVTKGVNTKHNNDISLRNALGQWPNEKSRSSNFSSNLREGHNSYSHIDVRSTPKSNRGFQHKSQNRSSCIKESKNYSSSCNFDTLREATGTTKQVICS